MTKIQQKIETLFAGFIYVAIGTVLAVQVNAQGNAKDRGPASVTPPANCEANSAPDALCTIAPSAKPDFKVCFSSKHPRCFELQKTKIIQSLNGMPAHDVAVDPKQSDLVVKAVKQYRSWLSSMKATPPTSVCTNFVTANFASDAASDQKEFCVSGIAKKALQAKNKALIELLEAPPGAKSSR